jgi:hypothetical protein
MVASVVLEPSAAQAYAAAAQSAGDKATVITLENVLIPREAAPSFRNDAAPLFRELLAP